MVSPRRLSCAAVAVVVLVLCAACGARYVRMNEKGLTCGDAHRLAIEAVRRMGYTVAETTRPAPGVPGVVVASRQDGTAKRGLMVSVVCTMQGAEVEAKAEGGGLGAVSFPAEFRRSFAAAAANQAPPRTPAAHGVDVLMALERDGGQEQLGIDLSAVGVLPVRVRITNHTARSYRFKPAGVAARNSAGERVRPLSLTELAGKLGSEPTPALREKLLRPADIEPDQTLRGFLLLPFDVYSRAQVELIDRTTGESEGFSVEF